MKIVAIGGARSTESFRKMIRHALKMTGKKNPNVLSIPTAITDEPKYVENFDSRYKKIMKCKTDSLLIAKLNISKKEMQKKIDWADAVHVCGGNTLKMMRRWRRIGLDKIILKAIKQGKVFYGESAGAICWFSYGHSDSMWYYNKKKWDYIFVKGFGLIDAYVAPHFYEEKRRVNSIKKLVDKKNIKLIGIDADAAIVVDGKNIYSIKGSNKGNVYVVEKVNNKPTIRKFNEKKDILKI